MIAGAVAHAYSARRVIGFDHNPDRVAFAKSYLSPTTGKPIFGNVFLTDELPETAPDGSTNGALSNGCSHAHAPLANGHGHGEGDGPRHVPSGDHKFEWAKRRVASWLKMSGLLAEGGVDKIVEATGAEDGMMYGIALGRQGSACESSQHFTSHISVIWMHC